MLFKDEAIEKQIFHIYTDNPSARMTMEYCVMHVQNCTNPVTVYYSRLAAIASATHLIHKLPLSFDLPLMFCYFHLFPAHLFTLESVVDLGFQCNPFPFLPVSGHCMPISYFNYLQTLLYPLSLSHICPSHNHKHQSS